LRVRCQTVLNIDISRSDFTHIYFYYCLLIIISVIFSVLTGFTFCFVLDGRGWRHPNPNLTLALTLFARWRQAPPQHRLRLGLLRYRLRRRTTDPSVHPVSSGRMPSNLALALHCDSLARLPMPLQTGPHSTTTNHQVQVVALTPTLSAPELKMRWKGICMLDQTCRYLPVPRPHSCAPAQCRASLLTHNPDP
jgi:hypothetical protein